MGSEDVIEEAFLDVFCDLIYGGGWMDLERIEEIDRDCNWALVFFQPFFLSMDSVLTFLTDRIQESSHPKDDVVTRNRSANINQSYTLRRVCSTRVQTTACRRNNESKKAAISLF